ncbi:cyclase family protein [Egicoccus sp. AB-alg2]|uniref:cyclase family protein n=1 Tax=Egicoccus sp. AB-alg2 TaxID=3242693 RepID=UPI00359E4060
MADALLDAVRTGVRVYDLSRPYAIGMPQSPNHPVYWHSLPRRHGDKVREDGGSAANDIIVLGTHVGTHIDALAHVSHEGQLHGGVDAGDAQVGGRFPVHGIDQVAPGVFGGILLDVPVALGLDTCDPGYEITPADLDAALERSGAIPQPGDILLVRSGWGARWDEGAAYIGTDSGVPGVGEAGARWLAAHRPRAVGADTIAFEHLAPGKGHAVLPAHRVLLVEEGINIIETMNLEEIAAASLTEFTLALAPLPLVGATGSPLRPLALTSA